MKSFINFRHGNLILKLAETREEIEKARQLRYSELVQLHNQEISFDDSFDDSDFVYDHLLVMEAESGDVVGTYRLGRREHLKYIKEFAIESKFDVSSIKAAEGEILELSRMAIRADYRDGLVVRLLWKGLMEYWAHYDVRYLFGVVSLHTFDPQGAKNFLSYIYHNFVSDEFDLFAKPPVVEMNLLPKEEIDVNLARKEMHPILKAYMGMGCKFARNAHIDDKMLKSVDVMIVIDSAKINPKYMQLVTRLSGQE